MTLFNDTDIFTQGTAGKIIYDLPDGELMLIDQFIAKPEADLYYENLLNQTKWRHYEMELYNKKCIAPRMIAWYQDNKNATWPAELMKIRTQVEKEVQHRFNAVLLNLYRDGNDSVAWHSDKENNTGQNPTIASITFGETRIFKLRHKFNKELAVIEIPLHHGSFLLMSGTTNTFWQHQVPKTAKQILPRINLTFRQVYQDINFL